MKILIKSSPLKVAIIAMILNGVISSCGDYSNQIHIDENKKAIVACNGDFLRNVRIETPDTSVTYEGVDTIYFNKKTSASRISVFGDVKNDYILNLKPNSTYNIYSHSSNGDQGPYRIILETDNNGSIIHNNENGCQ